MGLAGGSFADDSLFKCHLDFYNGSCNELMSKWVRAFETSAGGSVLHRASPHLILVSIGYKPFRKKSPNVFGLFRLACQRRMQFLRLSIRLHQNRV